MEGLKILSETCTTVGGQLWIFTAFGIFIAIISIVSFIIGVIEGDGFVIFGSIIAFGLSLLLVTANSEKQYKVTTYEVTPIEEKYYIDLSKYTIVKTKGEVITLEYREEIIDEIND